MTDAPNVEEMEAVNELGLTAKQQAQVDDKLRRSRRGLIAGVTVVGTVLALLWGAIAWIGLDQVLQDRGDEMLTDFINQGGANEVADRILAEPGPITELLRSSSVELEGPFIVGHSNAGQTQAPIEGDHSFCFLTYVRAVSPECTCLVGLVDSSESTTNWRILAEIESNFEPIADEHACNCRAHCVNIG